MKIDNIGYRYTRDELEALRLILKLPVPIGIESVRLDHERYKHAIEGLCSSGLMISTEERALIDPILMLLIQEACTSRYCLRIRSANRHTILHQTPRMYLLSDCTVSGCTLTPMQDAQSVTDPAVAALTQHELPVFLEYFSENTVQSVEAISADEASAALKKMLVNIRIRPAN